MAFDLDRQERGVRAFWLTVWILLTASGHLSSQEHAVSPDTASLERSELVPVADSSLAVTDSLEAETDSATTKLDSLFPAEVSTPVDSDSLAPPDSAAVDSSLMQSPQPEPEDSLMRAFRAEPDAVSYSGDLIETFPEEDRVNISGHATLEYGDASLGADQISYDMEKKRLKASGTTVMEDPSGRVTGEEMEYDLDSGKGVIRKAETSQEKWYFEGETISKVGENTLYGRNTDLTTCDSPEPHYFFKTKKFKLVVGDKVIARPIIFYVRNIPVFVFPFYVFPIETGRRSGILKPNFGLFSEDERGRSITNLGYFWAASEYWDLTAGTDLYEKYRWTVWGEGRYKKRYEYDGRVYSSYTRDSYQGDRRRWELAVLHNQTLSKKASLKADVNIASDRNIYRDLSYDIDQVLQRSLKSRVTYNRLENWGSYYLSFDSDYSLENERTTFQAPAFRITKNSTSLFKAEPGQTLPQWYGKLSYRLSADFTNYRIQRTETEDSVSVETTTNYQTSNLEANVTDPMQLFGWLNVNPGFSYRELLFQSDEEGVGFIQQGTYTASATVFTRLYGIFDGPRIGPIVKWRHTISPQVSYSFTPSQMTDAGDESDFYRGISSTGTNRLFLTLSNDLDAKYVKSVNDKVETKNLTLARFVLNTSYDINRAKGGKPGWGNLSSRLESNPSDRFRFSLEATHSLFDDEDFDPFLTSMTTNFTVTGTRRTGREESQDELGAEQDFGTDISGSRVAGQTAYGVPLPRGLSGPWSFSLTHSLNKSRTTDTVRQSLRNSVSFDPSRNWRLVYSYQYDLTNGELQDQSITLRRDLHRWELFLSFRQLPNDRVSYEFRVNLKDIPALEARRAAQDI